MEFVGNVGYVIDILKQIKIEDGDISDIDQTSSEEIPEVTIACHKTVSDGSLAASTCFSDNRDSKVQRQRKSLLKRIDNSIVDIIGEEEKAKLLQEIKKYRFVASSSEFFLATVSGPNYNEETRVYKKIIAARSISTYPNLQDIGRAGEPICDFYYTRVFGSSTVLALADGCNWGEAPKLAATIAATSFVRYIQDRLHLVNHSKKAAEVIVKGFSVAHDSILRGHKKNIWDAGTATLLGGVLLPITDAKDDFYNESRRRGIGTSFPVTVTGLNLIPAAVLKKKQAKKSSPRRRNSQPDMDAPVLEGSDTYSDTTQIISSEAISISETSSRSISVQGEIVKEPTSSANQSSEEVSDLQTSIDLDSSTNGNVQNIPSFLGRIKRRRSTGARVRAHLEPNITPTRRKQKWAFVYGNVGDCKIFLYSWKHRTICDITYTSRDGSMNASDCGGRLGPYKRGGLPDIRNFVVSSFTARTNDLILVVSDGVHDNLDPQYLGLTPRDLHINEDDWDEVEPRVANKAKCEYREKKLLELIESTSREPEDICNMLAEYSTKTTDAGRRFMEDNPSLELPEDFAKYPGKMDHTTSIVLKVDFPDYSSSQLLRSAFEKKENILLTSRGHITQHDLRRTAYV